MGRQVVKGARAFAVLAQVRRLLSAEEAARPPGGGGAAAPTTPPAARGRDIKVNALEPHSRVEYG